MTQLDERIQFTVTQSEFDGYEGQWYLVDPIYQYCKVGTAVFNVKAPSLDVTIRDPEQNDGADVSGKSIPTGAKLQFQIGTNMYTVLDPTLRNPVYGQHREWCQTLTVTSILW